MRLIIQMYYALLFRKLGLCKTLFLAFTNGLSDVFIFFGKFSYNKIKELVDAFQPKAQSHKHSLLEVVYVFLDETKKISKKNQKQKGTKINPHVSLNSVLLLFMVSLSNLRNRKARSIFCVELEETKVKNKLEENTQFGIIFIFIYFYLCY